MNENINEYLLEKLKNEWHPDNSKQLESYNFNSSYKVKWLCSKNPCGCHWWKASIDSRVRLGNNCPYCELSKLCPHNHIGITHSDIAKEWSPNNNSIDKYLACSREKVEWICSKEQCGCHIWKTTIHHRAYDNNGCPYCSGRYACPHRNLSLSHPHLIEEWHEDNEVLIINCLPGSHLKIKWKCKNDKCGCHIWTAAISDRTNGGGCPFCLNRRICPHNNVEYLRPDLAKEWHEDNKPMNEYPPSSNVKVKWKCQADPCGCHQWWATICSRTRDVGSGCSHCAGKSICPHNNVEYLHPDLAKEWHEDNKPMTLYTTGSNFRAKWRCSDKPNHVWETSIANRTNSNAPTGCPMCAHWGYSKSQIQWLTDIETAEHINIQHALKPLGEYKIAGVGSVDGYCAETNTVYEYHGDFWHGNPELYNQNAINGKSKKSFGELYKKTVLRDQKIRDLGYNLITIWDSEYNKKNEVKSKELNHI